ncbi:MAG: glutamine-hydrolyzing carbamoyl-phosphate synthase small subunit [Alphaproteobacteria bacterium]|nr:glutamine-hydrolyzing carbamoyl-phosphate synthase small subunit [Alphaproteobacteria bacterium]
MTVTNEKNAVLVLADGTVFYGQGIGATGVTAGEICFNTGMSGYQEVLTDLSYAGQIITFTFPHIGNVGCNAEDMEAAKPAATGLVLREKPTLPSNFRSEETLGTWLVRQGLTGICGVDTRRLTRHIREKGAQNAVIQHGGKLDIKALAAKAKAHPSMEGLDLARQVTCKKPYEWSQTRWALGSGYGEQKKPSYHVVAIDYGAKLNILRSLAAAGFKVTVVPCDYPAEKILEHKPDGIFLSNGPGDPAATGQYAVPILKKLVDSSLPIFGICLGHQLLALTLGAKTVKLPQGHRGANHPVKDLETGKVEITSQNHGFAVEIKSLPKGVKHTHESLFDHTSEGLRVEGHPVFSVQYHPEASPGPQDSAYLFEKFFTLVEQSKRKAA